MSNIFPIEVDQGSTFLMTLDITNEVDGCQLDLTDWDYNGQIRDTYGAATASADFQMVSHAPTSGSLTAQLPTNRTRNMVPGNKYYDIEITSGSVVLRLMEGTCKVSPEVTK